MAEQLENTLPHNNDPTSEYEAYQLSPEQLIAVETVGDLALAEMHRRYGNGRDASESGTEVTFPLHGSAHGQQVGIDTARLAEHLGLPSSLVAVAQSIGKGHDAVLTDGCGAKLARGEMEEVTARHFEGWAAETPGTPTWLAGLGRQAILGTQPSFDENGGPRGQEVKFMQFPDKATELVAYSVACADLGAPFTAAGPLCANRWYLEDRGFQSGEQPVFDDARLADIITYWTGQRNFIDGFQFSHPAANELFGADGLRSRVVAFHDQMLADLKAGKVASWEMIEARAAAFFKAHAQSAVGTGSAALMLY